MSNSNSKHNKIQAEIEQSRTELEKIKAELTQSQSLFLKPKPDLERVVVDSTEITQSHQQEQISKSASQPEENVVKPAGVSRIKEKIRVLISDGGRHRLNSGYGHVARSFALALLKDERFEVIFLNTRQPWEYEGEDRQVIESISRVQDKNSGDIVLQIGSPLSFKTYFKQPCLFFTLCDLSDLSPDAIEVIQKADAIITGTTSGQQVFKRYTSQVYVTPLAVDHHLFKPVSRWRKEGKDQFSFIFVGSFSFRKGVDLLIQSFFEEFDSTEANLLLHCPQSNLEKMITQVKKQLQVKSIPKNIFLRNEAVTPAWLNRYYNRADVFVTLTRGEGWGLPITEAMLCGLPVIAPLSTAMLDYLNEEVAFCLPTYQRSISEITDDFGQGFKKHEGTNVNYFEVNIQQARETMRAVFLNRQKAAIIGEKGRQHILKNWSIDRFSEAVYQAIIDFSKSKLKIQFREQSKVSFQKTKTSDIKISPENLSTLSSHPEPKQPSSEKSTSLGSKKLEIGAGSKPKPGYLHHDIRPLNDIDIVCDARKFPDELYETFDEVYASNILEHFNRFEVRDVLKEWTKLVRPGGKIEIIVPDIREISRQFVEGYIDIEFFNYLNYGGNDYEYNIHKFGFDAALLEKMLKSLYFEVVTSQPGIKWEDRKVDRYCPMVRIIAQKTAPQVFKFAGHTFEFFYHQGNCGFPPEPRTERTVEIPIAEKWLALAGKDVWEIGAVTCNYFQPLRVEKIIDPYDKHPSVTDKVSMMDVDLREKKVLSISTVEHIGKPNYEGNKANSSLSVQALDKIFSESPCFLITFPMMYDSRLDEYIFNKNVPPDVKVRFLIRQDNQSWEEVDTPERAKKTYGKTLKSDGRSAGADAIVVLERGNLLSLPIPNSKTSIPIL